MGHAWVCAMVGCGKMEDYSVKNEEYRCLEYQKLRRTGHREKRIDVVSRLWFYDRLKLESLANRDQHESKYGLLHPSHKKTSENASARHW